MVKHIRLSLDLQSLGSVEPPRLPGERPLTVHDAPALGKLAYDAFLGGGDDEGETVAEHVAEMAKTLNGDYGPLLMSASLGFAPQGELSGAIVVTVEKGVPFIPYCLVEPGWQGQGIGSQLILRSAERLAADGHRELTLAAVEGGRAELLYRRLGFHTSASQSESSLPPAGWYPDPEDKSGRTARYWIGSDWTGRTRKASPAEIDGWRDAAIAAQADRERAASTPAVQESPPVAARPGRHDDWGALKVDMSYLEEDIAELAATNQRMLAELRAIKTYAGWILFVLAFPILLGLIIALIIGLSGN